MNIKSNSKSDQNWITEYLTDLWGSTDIYLPNGQYDASALPAFYTEDKEVVLTYNFSDRFDIVTFNIPYGYDQKPIDELIAALKQEAQANAFGEIYATTTNDNLDLMGYLQRTGFRFHKIYPCAIDQSREKHNAIPEMGRNDIPMRDEIEFMLKA